MHLTPPPPKKKKQQQPDSRILTNVQVFVFHTNFIYLTSEVFTHVGLHDCIPKDILHNSRLTDYLKESNPSNC